MNTVIRNLQSFNRKERFWLLYHVMGMQDHSFYLSDYFKDQLNQVFGFDNDSLATAYVAMDYHLDWIEMAVRLGIQPLNGDVIPRQHSVVGTQQDVDLLVALESEGITHILMVEAKGDTAWSNKQLQSKSTRLQFIFDRWDPDQLVVVPHFLMMSPRQPQRVKSNCWPEWMKSDNQQRWLELELPGSLVKFTRCDEGGDPNPNGEFLRRRSIS